MFLTALIAVNSMMTLVSSKRSLYMGCYAPLYKWDLTIAWLNWKHMLLVPPLRFAAVSQIHHCRQASSFVMPYQLLRNMIILPGSTVVTFQRCPQSSAMTPQPASVPDSRFWPWHNLLPSRWSLTTDRVPGNPLVCPCSEEGCAALLKNTLQV